MVGMPGVVTLTLETLNLLLLFAGVLGYHPRENKGCLAAGIAVLLFRGATVLALQEAFIFHRYLAMLVPAAAMPCFFKGRPSVSLVIGITMVQIVSMMDTLNIGIWTLAVKGEVMKVDLVWTYYLGALGCLAVLGILSVAVRKKRREIHEMTENISLWVFIPFLVCLYMLTHYSPWVFVGNGTTERLQQMAYGKNIIKDGFISFILISFLVVSCALISQHRQMKRRLLLNERCIREQTEQYRRQGEEDMELRRFRHDYNAHITALQALAEEDDPQRLQDYVRDMSELKAIRSSYNTNNLISDAILNRYGRLCEKEEIRMEGTGKFPDQISVTDTDLCVILSNAMKNAYEAAIQCEKGEISFEVKSTGSFINLVIRNSAKDQPELEEGYLITTKKDKKNHGIGTRNMVETARKNGGDVTWEWDEGGYVTTNILLRGSPRS